MVAEQQNPLRKVAVLVATLDDQRAKQLLADLPRDIAHQVALLAAELDDVTVGERKSIADEFRQHMSDSTSARSEKQPSQANNGVELDTSLLERLETQSSYERPDDYRMEHSHSDSRQPRHLEQAHIDSIADRIVKEHPQTMALILSRLEYDRAAKILGQLPTELQADVLSRIGRIEAPDQETIHAIESQLQDWIDTHRRRQNRMAAGANLVQSILSQSTRQETILAKISQQDPVLAGNLSLKIQENIVSSRNASAVYREQLNNPPPQRTDPTPIAEPSPLPTSKPQSAPAPSIAEDFDYDPMVELEKASTHVLTSCLSRISERTLKLALVGASEGMLQRILKGLSRRQANSFRKQLTQFGPIQLSEMIAAQKELLNLVRSYPQ